MRALSSELIWLTDLHRKKVRFNMVRTVMLNFSTTMCASMYMTCFFNMLGFPKLVDMGTSRVSDSARNSSVMCTKEIKKVVGAGRSRLAGVTPMHRGKEEKKARKESKRECV